MNVLKSKQVDLVTSQDTSINFYDKQFDQIISNLLEKSIQQEVNVTNLNQKILENTNKIIKNTSKLTENTTKIESNKSEINNLLLKLAELANKVKEGALPASAKEKLDSIEYGATRYIHPKTHPASMIEQNSERVFISQKEKDKLNNMNISFKVTLLSSSWKNKQCVIRHSSIKSDSLIIISLPIGSSNSVRNMMSSSNLQCVKQTDGEIVLQVLTVPDFDVNILILVTAFVQKIDTINSTSE